eukprot:Nitzschia sp. Nitz4//scaffold199_size41809//32539//34290//NITZ4_007457-RA/size41809-snap-gene-0.71-mRNA-1//-1//CDS//3329540582//3219//frame0
MSNIQSRLLLFREMRFAQAQSRSQNFVPTIIQSWVMQGSRPAPVHASTFLSRFNVRRIDHPQVTSIIMSQWTTSGRSRLKAKQNRSFSYKALRRSNPGLQQEVLLPLLGCPPSTRETIVPARGQPSSRANTRYSNSANPILRRGIVVPISTSPQAATPTLPLYRSRRIRNSNTRHHRPYHELRYQVPQPRDMSAGSDIPYEAPISSESWERNLYAQLQSSTAWAQQPPLHEPQGLPMQYVMVDSNPANQSTDHRFDHRHHLDSFQPGELNHVQSLEASGIARFQKSRAWYDPRGGDLAASGWNSSPLTKSPSGACNWTGRTGSADSIFDPSINPTESSVSGVHDEHVWPTQDVGTLNPPFSTDKGMTPPTNRIPTSYPLSNRAWGQPSLGEGNNICFTERPPNWQQLDAGAQGIGGPSLEFSKEQRLLKRDECISGDEFEQENWYVGANVEQQGKPGCTHGDWTEKQQAPPLENPSSRRAKQPPNGIRFFNNGAEVDEFGKILEEVPPLKRLKQGFDHDWTNNAHKDSKGINSVAWDDVRFKDISDMWDSTF